APIHRINGDGGRAQPAKFPDGVDLRIPSETPKRHHVGGGLIFQQASSLQHKRVHGARRILGGGVGPFRLEWLVTGLLWISVVDSVSQLLMSSVEGGAAKDDDKAMLTHRLDKYFHTRHAHLLKQPTHGLATFGGGTAGPK